MKERQRALRAGDSPHAALDNRVILTPEEQKLQRSVTQNYEYTTRANIYAQKKK